MTSDLAMEILTALPLDIGAPWDKVATRWQIDDARAVLDFPMLSTARRETTYSSETRWITHRGALRFWTVAPVVTR